MNDANVDQFRFIGTSCAAVHWVDVTSSGSVHALSERYLLEREYLRSEHDRSLPLRLLVVGLLLGFAFGRQGADKRLDELVSRLERV